MCYLDQDTVMRLLRAPLDQDLSLSEASSDPLFCACKQERFSQDCVFTQARILDKHPLCMLSFIFTSATINTDLHGKEKKKKNLIA